MKIRLVVSGRSYPTSRPLPPDLTLRDGASIDEALDVLKEQLLQEKCFATNVHDRRFLWHISVPSRPTNHAPYAMATSWSSSLRWPAADSETVSSDQPDA